MRTKFTQVSYKEVSETRKKALMDYTHDMASWRSIKELSLHCLKRFPFLVIWVILFDIYVKYCNTFVVNSICAFLGIEDIVGETILTAISLALFGIFSYVIMFSMADHMFPRKTPINDMVSRIRKFHDETKYLEPDGSYPYNAYDFSKSRLTEFSEDTEVKYVPSELILHQRDWEKSDKKWRNILFIQRIFLGRRVKRII